MGEIYDISLSDGSRNTKPYGDSWRWNVDSLPKPSASRLLEGLRTRYRFLEIFKLKI
jgi:hypothetical protein